MRRHIASERSNETRRQPATHTDSPPHQQPDQPKGLANAWLAGDDEARVGLLSIQLLQPVPEHKAGLADQNPVPQQWRATKRCRYDQEADLLCSVLDGSCKPQDASLGLPGGQGGLSRPLECCKSRKGLSGSRLCAELTSACWGMLPHALSSSTPGGSMIVPVPEASSRCCPAARCHQHAT